MSSHNRFNFFRRDRPSPSRDSDSSFACRGLYEHPPSQWRSHQPRSSNSAESFACRGLAYNEEDLEVSRSPLQPSQANRPRQNAFYDDYYASPSATAHQNIAYYTVPVTSQSTSMESDQSFCRRSRRRDGVLLETGHPPPPRRRDAVLFENGYRPTHHHHVDQTPSRRQPQTTTRNLQSSLQSRYREEASGNQRYGRGAIDYNAYVDSDEEENMLGNHATNHQASFSQRRPPPSNYPSSSHRYR
ncbi:uncharacterized protein MELLADRAFT_113016 [Melampsora larici-populina 98AG31]|uniref:Uncharacterized protein n=1 Tax=Melampsora larici-populina (strain 98AG31 / pathotype 3-4-7) TaxID=747676 RepID=F4S8F2_MELLP|nr:uncharacterized protein MELLADRAFT_113016 [Melampsora larici-populina 98AG31]EGF99086.1 hypothetical protein MELLADRAFT_113016 [Melampsora larici-populina 98AG31]